MSTDSKNADLLQIDVFEVLRRRFPLIVLGSLAGIGLAAAYCFTATTRYETNGVVMVMPKDSRLTSSNSSGTELGMQANVGEELLATHMQILTSPRVIKAALLSPEKDELGNEIGTPLIGRESLSSQIPSAAGNADSALFRKHAVQYIKKNLSVSRGGEGASKDAQVLRVRLEHTDAMDSQAFLNSIISSYENFLVDTSDKAGSNAQQLFQEASKELGSKLEEIDKTYSDFLMNAPTLVMSGPNGPTNIHQQQAAEIQRELSSLRMRTSELRSRVKITEEALNDPELDPSQKITVLDPSDVQRLTLMINIDSLAYDRTQSERSQESGVKYGQLLGLMRELSSDSITKGDNHPDIVRKKEEIQQIQSMLDAGETATLNRTVDLNRLVSLYHTMLKKDLKHEESRVGELAKLLEEEEFAAKQLIETQLEESRLKRDRERTEELYNTVVDRLREVDLAKSYGAFTTELISPPDVGLKSWPKIPLLIALGTLLGTISGAALAVAAEIGDRSFRGHEDIEKELSTSVLTHVPVMLPRDMRKTKSGSSLAPQLIAFHQPKSHHSEAVRNLRASVYFRTNDLDSPIIQITSPNPGDGKSTMTANLAVSIAQTNKRVLLIECDMRRPSQHKIFGFDRDVKGLADVLKRECSIDEATMNVGEIPNLSIIPSGGIPENPAELLALPDFNQFLAVVRDEYDFILVDSPPIAPVSDSAIIASLVDRVVLAITLSKSARNAASAAQEALVSHGANLMGLVVSKYGGANSYGGYSGYGYGYGYGAQYGDKYQTYTYS